MLFPFVLSGFYLFAIFSIQSYMKERQAFHLRTPLAIWSLVIGLFRYVYVLLPLWKLAVVAVLNNVCSLFGAIRTIPALAKMIANRGLVPSICHDTR